MLGAIIGDIVGSKYEFDMGRKTKDFPFFSEECNFTDDTVMTCAVAEAVMQGRGLPLNDGANIDKLSELFIYAMKKYGRLYPYAGYGIRFDAWLKIDDRKPYNSYGNGSAMRVSPTAWAYNTLDEVERAAEISAAVTHNHPEGIKGAKATAAAIYLARKRSKKAEIKEYIVKTYGYDLSRTLDEIRPNYRHVESCQESVPEAITAFLESVSFEDAIRNVISIGGDCDTTGAICGSIAEAAYGIPDEIGMKAWEYLDARIKEVVKSFYKKLR